MPDEPTLETLSPDGTLAVLDLMGETLVLEIATGRIQARFAMDEGGRATRIRFDRSSQLLGRVNGQQVEVFDLRTGRRDARFTAGFPVVDLAFSEDLRLVTVVSSTAQFERRTIGESKVKKGDAGAVSGPSRLTSDGAHVVFAAGLEIRVAPVGGAACKAFKASASVVELAVSEDSSTIAALLEDAVEVFDASSGALRGQFKVPARTRIALTAGGDGVLVESRGASVRDASGKVIRELATLHASVGPGALLAYESTRGINLTGADGVVTEHRFAVDRVLRRPGPSSVVPGRRAAGDLRPVGTEALVHEGRSAEADCQVCWRRLDEGELLAAGEAPDFQHLRRGNARRRSSANV
jgi:hypothetical protein